MKNPRALRNSIFAESLADETILYDKLAHKAHSLNKTVAMVWESADGHNSVSEIAAILHHRLGIPEDRSVVLLALEELQAADLLATPLEFGGAGHISRREVARRFALAGASAALVPFIASVLAPTAAMASSAPKLTFQQIVADERKVGLDLAANPSKDTVTLLSEYDSGITAGNMGEVDALLNQQAGAQADFAIAQSDFNGVLKALGLPPLG